LLLLRANTYKRRIHVPQILSVLDANPSDLDGLEPAARESAVLNKLILLLKYSARNNDKDDLLNTMARTEETREIWREMKTAVMKLHKNESDVRANALDDDQVKLSETSWGQVLVRMDNASREAMDQGGFSLTFKPSTISTAAVGVAQLAAIGSGVYAQYSHNILQIVGSGILNLFQ
jgi:hypothetical protein